MSALLSRRPAWVLTATYVAASLGGVLIIGRPSDGGVGLWFSVGVLMLYAILVWRRGHHPAGVLGTTIGTTAAIALLTDLFSVSQPWQGAAALILLPLAVYLACDRREGSATNAK